jgi:hypothetical protein
MQTVGSGGAGKSNSDEILYDEIAQDRIRLTLMEEGIYNHRVVKRFLRFRKSSPPFS